MLDDFADSELLDRLIQRGMDRTMAELAVANRDQPEVAEAIAEELGLEEEG